MVITLDEKRGSIRAIEANGKPLEPTAEEMPIIAGVISLALLTYETEVVHDEETDVITFQHYSVTDLLMHKPLRLNPNPIMGSCYPSPSLHHS